MSDESATVLTSMDMETVKLSATVSMKSFVGNSFLLFHKETDYSVQSAEDLEKTLYSHTVSLYPGVKIWAPVNLTL